MHANFKEGEVPLAAGGLAWDDCPVGHVVHNICFMICGKDS